MAYTGKYLPNYLQLLSGETAHDNKTTDILHYAHELCSAIVNVRVLTVDLYTHK